jgi:hypothetical protein
LDGRNAPTTRATILKYFQVRAAKLIVEVKALDVGIVIVVLEGMIAVAAEE